MEEEKLASRPVNKIPALLPEDNRYITEEHRQMTDEMTVALAHWARGADLPTAGALLHIVRRGHTAIARADGIGRSACALQETWKGKNKSHLCTLTGRRSSAL